MEQETVQHKVVLNLNEVKSLANEKKPTWTSFYLVKFLFLIGIIIGSAYLYGNVCEKRRPSTDPDPLYTSKSPNPYYHYTTSAPQSAIGSNGIVWSAPQTPLQLNPYKQHDSRLITPTCKELLARKMVLTYSINDNAYYRPNDNNKKIKGFEQCMYYAENVYRKYEWDWKQVYLCRREGTDQAYFMWKVSLQHLKPTSAYVSIGNFTLFETGKASASVCTERHSTVCTKLNKEINLNEIDLRGIDYFMVSVTLNGGSGHRAWQHSQLFRTPIKSSNSLLGSEESLRIEINFEYNGFGNACL